MFSVCIVKKIKTPLVMSLGLALSISAINAQTKDSIQTREIEEVYIKGQTLKAKNSSTQVGIITNEEIKNLAVEQPLRLLEQITGVNVNAYGQGGVADEFSIRGFSSGGHGGDVAVEIDGVSLNESEGHSDGYADMNILIPLALKKISVYKGPSSALFGRFSKGGTVSLETRKGGNYNDIRLSGGSYNTFDVQYAMGKSFRIGERENALKTNFATQWMTTKGFIQNSDILKGNVNGRIAYQISDKSEIALSVLGHKSDYHSPGYLTVDYYYENFDKRRNYPQEYYQNDGGSKTFVSERLDFNHKINDNIKLLLFGYAVQQDFSRIRKPRYFAEAQRGEYYKRNVYALGGSLNGNNHIADKNFNWIAGFEFYNEDTNEERWNTSHRKKISQVRDRDYNVNSFSVYAQGEWDLHQLFKPSVGLRFDTFAGKFENNDPNAENFTKKFNGLSHFSPKLGFRSNLVGHLDFRTNVSNGFSLPDDDYSTLKYDKDAKVKPIQLWQYETGFSYNNDKNFSFDITGYIINSSREVYEDLVTGELLNTGKTRRSGVEVGTKWSVAEGLILRGNFTYTDSKILEGDNVGNKVGRVPQTVLNLGVNYTSPIGLGADVDFRNNSDYYTSNNNAYKDGGYQLVNFRVFYNFDKLFSNKGNVFVAVNNLFNEKYAEIIFGKSTISAAPERNVSVGINYSF